MVILKIKGIGRLNLGRQVVARQTSGSQDKPGSNQESDRNKFIQILNYKLADQ